MTRPRTSERLLARLHEPLAELGIELPEGARPKRTNPSPAGRDGGGWRWFVVDADGAPVQRGGGAIGSPETMGHLVKVERLGATREERSGDIVIHDLNG